MTSNRFNESELSLEEHIVMEPLHGVKNFYNVPVYLPPSS